MNKNEIIKKLRNSKDTLLADFGIESIGLFGSYAKDSASRESDIDLIYIPKQGVRIGYTKKMQLENYLTRLLFSKKIDLVNYKYINPIVKSNIEGNIIYV